MRVISLSVDGIVQAAQRGLFEWLASQDADLICLQDLRALEREIEKPEFQLDGYFWNKTLQWRRHLYPCATQSLNLWFGLFIGRRYGRTLPASRL